MRCKYLPQDLNARLHGGIAFYGKKPVYVEIVDNQIRLFSLRGDYIGVINEDDELFDISSPDLGYVNINQKIGNKPDNTAIYVERIPNRRYKQTLTLPSLNATYSYIRGENRNAHFNLELVWRDKCFEDMLIGKYPTLEEALLRLNKTSPRTISVAINRDICLYKNSYGQMKVYFKGDEVGFVRPGENIVRIPPSGRAWVVSKYLDGFSWEID